MASARLPKRLARLKASLLQTAQATHVHKSSSQQQLVNAMAVAQMMMVTAWYGSKVLLVGLHCLGQAAKAAS
jgi:hypothetical protein